MTDEAAEEVAAEEVAAEEVAAEEVAAEEVAAEEVAAEEVTAVSDDGVPLPGRAAVDTPGSIFHPGANSTMANFRQVPSLNTFGS